MVKRPIHALHVGKTGGSALQHALAPYAQASGVILHGHDWTLADVPLGEKAIFIVRAPPQRFVSGFNSRLRKGLPRVFNDWTEAEALAFSQFATPTALAEGLISAEAAVRNAAIIAINSIYHPALHLAYWLRSATYLQQRRDDIIWIGLTDHLDGDFSRLVRRLELPTSLKLPADPVTRHATPNGFETTLTNLGEEAVLDWYADDADILLACLELRRALHRASAELSPIGLNSVDDARLDRLEARA